MLQRLPFPRRLPEVAPLLPLEQRPGLLGQLSALQLPALPAAPMSGRPQQAAPLHLSWLLMALEGIGKWGLQWAWHQIRQELALQRQVAVMTGVHALHARLVLAV